MNDKALFDNLTQYDICVNRITKGRGGAYIFSDKGCKLFLECDKADSFYLRENAITKALARTGYPDVDTYFENVDGEIITFGIDGKKYVMKNWFDGRECDVKNIDDLVRAMGALAHLHVSLLKLSGEKISYDCREDASLKSRKWDSMAENEDTREAEIAGGCRGIEDVGIAGDAGGCRGAIDFLGQEAVLRACDVDFGKGMDVRESNRRHMREIKKAGNYMRSKKRKNEFEQMVLRVIDDFYDEAVNATRELESEEIEERFLRARQSGELSHGRFNYHNVFFVEKSKRDGNEGVAITNFDRVKNECQIVDLYDFLRKVLEKYNWDCDVAYKLLDEYDRVKAIDDADLELLIGLFRFPEKFWKVINQYYNAGKAWIPSKNVEKLKTVIRQNSRRREFIDKICGVC